LDRIRDISSLCDESDLPEALDGSVEGARTQLDLSICPGFDLLDDAKAVTGLVGQSE
jgi:hypothetical protein